MRLIDATSGIGKFIFIGMVEYMSACNTPECMCVSDASEFELIVQRKFSK